MSAKFRLWCDNKKEWEKDEWYLTPNGRIIDARRGVELKKDTHFINKYIGLKDKNGVEIYEGDIVKKTVLKVANAQGEGIGKNTIKEVKFNPYFGFSGIGRADRIKRKIDELEVIGNIYENKELCE